MNGLERTVAIFGTQAAVARATKRHYQEIHKWLGLGTVPMKHCAVFVAAVLAEIPNALARGVAAEIARPVTYHELNPGYPPSMPLPTETESLAGV